MSDRELIAAAQALIDGDRAEAWRYPTVWEPLVARLKIAAQAQAPTNQQLLDALCEELVIMVGIVKEICHERSVPIPAYSIKRAEDAIAAAQEQGE